MQKRSIRCALLVCVAVVLIGAAPVPHQSPPVQAAPVANADNSWWQ